MCALVSSGNFAAAACCFGFGNQAGFARQQACRQPAFMSGLFGKGQPTKLLCLAFDLALDCCLLTKEAGALRSVWPG